MWYMWLGYCKITQKGRVMSALTTRIFSPFKIWMDISFTFLQICPFQRRKHTPPSTVWFCVIRVPQPLTRFVYVLICTPFLLPQHPQCATGWLCPLVSFPRSPTWERCWLSPGGEGRCLLKFLRITWGGGQFLARAVPCRPAANVQGREPGQLQIETPVSSVSPGSQSRWMQPVRWDPESWQKLMRDARGEKTICWKLQKWHSHTYR